MKAQALNRKQFIHGKLSNEQAIRPPWSVDESVFTQACTRCYKCAESCHSQLIVKGTGGFPEMSFLRHGCDYCEACVRACPENVLIKNEIAEKPAWQQCAVIDESCFSTRGTVCRACGEVCESQAIKFKPAVGGVSTINLNPASCDGCGECVHVCPAHAIKIQKIKVEMLHE